MPSVKRIRTGVRESLFDQLLPYFFAEVWQRNRKTV
jgi:hypothetical protein